MTARADALSPREQEVLALIAAGKTNQQIADELIISRATANRHVHNIITKLGVSNRTEAVGLASVKTPPGNGLESAPAAGPALQLPPALAVLPNPSKTCCQHPQRKPHKQSLKCVATPSARAGLMMRSISHHWGWQTWS